MNVSVSASRICAVLAFACFLLATFGVMIAGHPLVPPGLAFIALALLVP